jgi:DNA-binding transcriptional ArsR family regulator
MTAPRDSWLDRDAGPVVRPYAMTKGRTVSGAGDGASFGLIDVVIARDQAPPEGFRLSPEQRQILALSRQPITVVDLASDLDLPVGVVRLLLSDLSEHGLVTIRPARRAPVTDARLLRDVLDGLQAL